MHIACIYYRCPYSILPDRHTYEIRRDERCFITYTIVVVVVVAFFQTGHLGLSSQIELDPWVELCNIFDFDGMESAASWDQLNSFAWLLFSLYMYYVFFSFCCRVTKWHSGLGDRLFPRVVQLAINQCKADAATRVHLQRQGLDQREAIEEG